MSGETYILRSALDVRRLAQFLGQLTFDRHWKVVIDRVEPGAGQDQEAVLRGMETKIARFTGHDPDEIHDEMLARHYGTEEVSLGAAGVLRRPARRTKTGKNRLSRSEMQEHMRFVEAFAACELGLQVGNLIQREART